MGAKKWQIAGVPVTGHGGEQSAVAPDAFDPSEVRLLRNAVITGRGVVQQHPDFVLADTGLTLTGAEVEAIAGIFPFATQGSAVRASAGVAFGWSFINMQILLFQLDEDHVIMRSFVVYKGWEPSSGEAIPPRITGFEMEGKFWFNAYGLEAATTRQGMGFFDPAGIVTVTSSSAANPTVITTPAHGFATGDVIGISGHTGSDDDAAVNTMNTITVLTSTTFELDGVDLSGGGGTGGSVFTRRPVYDLGGGAGLLRFRGIVKHRGGLVLGFGYRKNDDADRGDIFRWAKYITPLTWVTDVTDTSSGAAVLGTLGLEIIAAAATGQYTVLGKKDEIYALDGDYGVQLYARRIGEAFGPVSTTGIVGTEDAAFWMSEKGPVITDNGRTVRLLGTDKLFRTFLRYFSLEQCWATHDSRRERIVWTMRRKLDENFDTLPSDEPYARDLLFYDYRRHAFYHTDVPNPIWSVGFTSGPGLATPGPTGVLTIDAATVITQNGFTLNFTPADTTAGVSYVFERRLNGGSIWVPIGTVHAPAVLIKVTGLTVNKTYDVRGKQVRNGQPSAFTTSTSYATTLDVGDVPLDATGFDVVSELSSSDDDAVPTHVVLGWDPRFDADVSVTLFAGATSVFASSNPVPASNPSAGDGGATDTTDRSPGDVVHYWIRFENAGGVSAGDPVQAATFPYTVLGPGPL